MYGIAESQVSVESSSNIEQENKAKLELIHKLRNRSRSVPYMTLLLEQIIKMTQQNLDAMAASIILFDDNEKELYVEVASGPVGKVLQRVKISAEYSIAGHVARTKKPLIVNDVQRSPNFHKAIDEITGFVTKSMVCAPLVANRKVMGVIEVLNKLDCSDFDDRDIEAVTSIAATAAMALENTRLHQTILETYIYTITALAAAIDAIDPYAHGHSQRVMEYSLMGGASLLNTSEEMEILEYASILHDIGKIAIDARILNKSDHLTSSEWNIMREHSAIGARFIKEIPFLTKASNLILYHHERYDGSGYPAGLKHKEIPLGARLISVADAFDTMTTNRSYRPIMTMDQAINELYRCSGRQFCPDAVEAFVSKINLCINKNHLVN